MSISFNNAKQAQEAFIKIYGPKTPFWRYYLRSILDFIGIRQPVEYYNKTKRLEFECQTLRLWKAYGLNVPSVISREDAELHLSIVEGETLFNIFGRSINFDIVAQLFDDLNYRHQLAFKHNEPRLCHIDSNLKNIMYSDQRIFHIDFEMGRKSEPVNMWAQREVTKLLISLSQVTESMQAILPLFFSIYTHTEIVENFINNKIGAKSQKVTKAKLNKKEYTLINLAVDMNNHLTNSRNE